MTIIITMDGGRQTYMYTDMSVTLWTSVSAPYMSRAPGPYGRWELCLYRPIYMLTF